MTGQSLSEHKLGDSPFNKQRHDYLDLIKGLAIFLVIETHAREMAGTNFYGFIIKTAYYSIDRNGVLLFFLCSGALLLSRKNHDIAKVAKRCFRLIVILSVYSVITNSVYYISHGKDITLEIKDALTYNNMLTYFNYDKAIHLWFLCSYIPLLIASPFVGLAVRSMSDRMLTACIMVLMICGPISKVMITLGAHGFEIFNAGDNATFLMYMIVGFAIHNDRIIISKTKPVIALIIVLSSCFASVYCQAFMHGNSFFGKDDWRVLNNYASSIFLIPSSIFTFILIKNLRMTSSFIEKAGRSSFGIYLIHYVILIFIFRGISENHSLFEKYLIAMSMAIITLPASLIAVKIIKKTGLSYLIR